MASPAVRHPPASAPSSVAVVKRTFAGLPPDTLERCFTFLPLTDIALARRTCRDADEAAKQGLLWQKVALRYPSAQGNTYAAVKAFFLQQARSRATLINLIAANPRSFEEACSLLPITTTLEEMRSFNPSYHQMGPLNDILVLSPPVPPTTSLQRLRSLHFLPPMERVPRPLPRFLPLDITLHQIREVVEMAKDELAYEIGRFATAHFTDLVALLLQSSQVTGKMKSSILCKAGEERRRPLVTLLLKSRLSNQESSSGLVGAAVGGSLECVEEILATLTQPYDDGVVWNISYALDQAAQNAHFPVTKRLCAYVQDNQLQIDQVFRHKILTGFAAGRTLNLSDPKIKKAYHETFALLYALAKPLDSGIWQICLERAALVGDLDLLKILIQSEDLPITPAIRGGVVAAAAGKGRIEILKFLYKDVPADSKISDADHTMAVHQAARGDHAECAAYLLSKRALSSAEMEDTLQRILNHLGTFEVLYADGQHVSQPLYIELLKEATRWGYLPTIKFLLRDTRKELPPSAITKLVALSAQRHSFECALAFIENREVSSQVKALIRRHAHEARREDVLKALG